MLWSSMPHTLPDADDRMVNAMCQSWHDHQNRHSRRRRASRTPLSTSCLGTECRVLMAAGSSVSREDVRSTTAKPVEVGHRLQTLELTHRRKAGPAQAARTGPRRTPARATASAVDVVSRSGGQQRMLVPQQPRGSTPRRARLGSISVRSMKAAPMLAAGQSTTTTDPSLRRIMLSGRRSPCTRAVPSTAAGHPASISLSRSIVRCLDEAERGQICDRTVDRHLLPLTEERGERGGRRLQLHRARVQCGGKRGDRREHCVEVVRACGRPAVGP